MSGASREQADTFLRKQGSLVAKQGRLVDRQTEYLADKDKFELSHLRWRRFTEQMKGALQIMTAAMGTAVAAGLLMLAWNARQADGLVVESFSVPPAFIQAGVSGGVIADDLTSKIEEVRETALSQSQHSAKNVSNDRGEDIKVEIPDTGVSFSEAWRYLRLWLGHERQINGNIRNLTDGKIALTVSLAKERSFTFNGASGNLDQLEYQAAVKVFSDIDPYNYVLYLVAIGRADEALAAAERATQLAQTPEESAGAYALWSAMTRSLTANMTMAITRARIGTALGPKFIAAPREIMLSSMLLGHDEDALQQARLMLTMREEDQPAIQKDEAFKDNIALSKFFLYGALGDYAKAAAAQGGCANCPLTSLRLRRAEYLVRNHDIAIGRATIEEASAMDPLIGSLAHTNLGGDPHRARYYLDVERGDWRGAVRESLTFIASLQADPTAIQPLKALRVSVQGRPLLAYALARNGDLVAAHLAVDLSPGDCYLCMRARGRIDALEKNWNGADYWFARAARAAPSIPQAYTDWGHALLKHGKLDDAIVQFALANQRGPNFADPLEGWGEALMAKNQSHLALEKFGAANKYAPNWGRLHLKWGESLFYVGRKDEAKTQFAIAAGLDLEGADKAELLADVGRV